jgi:hypothetical protein
MNPLTFESVKTTGKGCKLYFTSYLRKDFVERSLVITIGMDFTVSHIYLSSYCYGSVEWHNGTGLSECRKWETEEQAEAPGYLTRRYTSRMSDGYAPEGHAEQFLIPDVLDNLANRKLAETVGSILVRKKSRIKIVPDDYNINCHA